jgi:hypothetical protein
MFVLAEWVLAWTAILTCLSLPSYQILTMCFVLNFFAVHHLRPTLHKLDLCHLSRKPRLFTTLLVSWDFVESYFQCWYPSSTIPSSAQRQVKFSHWMIPAYTSTKDIPSFHLCQALFTKTGRSACLTSLVFFPFVNCSVIFLHSSGGTNQFWAGIGFWVYQLVLAWYWICF